VLVTPLSAETKQPIYTHPKHRTDRTGNIAPKFIPAKKRRGLRWTEAGGEEICIRSLANSLYGTADAKKNPGVIGEGTKGSPASKQPESQRQQQNGHCINGAWNGLQRASSMGKILLCAQAPSVDSGGISDGSPPSVIFPPGFSDTAGFQSTLRWGR